MILSDLHVHTTFCDGKSSVEETLKKAVSMGMKSVGFSSHSYTPCDTSFCMTPETTKKYISEVNAAKERYRDTIEIYLGTERDRYFEDDNTDYDYIIGSVHYIKAGGVCFPVDESEKAMVKNVREFFGGDYLKYTKAYYRAAAQAAGELKADIIGHFDLVTKFNQNYKYFDESCAQYRNAALEAVKAASESCSLFEMNTGAVSRGFKSAPYPSTFILKYIKSVGGRIILSSDSHRADTLCFGFDSCCDILKECGFKSVTVLEGGRFIQRAI